MRKFLVLIFIVLVCNPKIEDCKRIVIEIPAVYAANKTIGDLVADAAPGTGDFVEIEQSDASASNKSTLGNLSKGLTVTSMISACTNAQVLGGTVAGTGVECQAEADPTVDTGAEIKAILGDLTLGTETAGNYVATITGTTNQISVAGSGAETAAVTISVPTTLSTTNVSADTVSVDTMLAFWDSNNSNKTFIVGGNQTDDITLTLPTDDGDANEFLQTNGSGTLTWTAQTAEADDLDDVTGRGATTANNIFVGGVSATNWVSADTVSVDTALIMFDSDNSHTSKFIGGNQAANIQYTLPIDDGDAGEQLQTNGSGVLSWESAGGIGGATAWDDIGDPDAATTIAFDNDEGTVFSTAEDTGIAFQVDDTDAALAGSTELLDLYYSVATTKTDANAVYLRMKDSYGDLYLFTGQQFSSYMPIVNYYQPAAGASGTFITAGQTLLAMDTAGDVVMGFYADLNGTPNHGAGSVYGFNADLQAGDAEATETAFKVTGGWDNSLDAADLPIINVGTFGQASDVIDAGAATSFEIPNANDVSANTGEAMISWDADNDILYVGDAAAVNQIPKAGTLTNAKYCTYDSAGGEIDCNSEGGSGSSVAASAVLTSISFSLDGGGGVITSGDKAMAIAPYNMNVTSIDAVGIRAGATVTGSIGVSLRKSHITSRIPTVTDEWFFVSMDNTWVSQDSNFTGKTVTSGDIVLANVCSSASKANCQTASLDRVTVSVMGYKT